MLSTYTSHCTLNLLFPSLLLFTFLRNNRFFLLTGEPLLISQRKIFSLPLYLMLPSKSLIFTETFLSYHNLCHRKMIFSILIHFTPPFSILSSCLESYDVSFVNKQLEHIGYVFPLKNSFFSDTPRVLWFESYTLPIKGVSSVQLNQHQLIFFYIPWSQT